MTLPESKMFIVAMAFLAIVLPITLVAVFSCQPAALLGGFAELVKALSWPCAIAFVLLTFRDPISSQFGRVHKIVGPGGVSIELEKTIAEQFKELDRGGQRVALGWRRQGDRR